MGLRKQTCITLVESENWLACGLCGVILVSAENSPASKIPRGPPRAISNPRA